ncbi:thiol reductant ABC exporter subunit CydD [Streptomyces sp. SID13031]|uniref:thiol reductant ABC exporter subunit CydD n=1 Tax=Streptomyces sp. SID13031 TaxID=2706046 RepID=UPI0013C5AB19|nr:thiol reductant ABC exporter subunit CydD [Streptomyces sp. SID13031]NEA32373.1 thiol reductant ABC exporter subunit CydD [Streptomyces sp. SID13031]
MPAIDPRLLRYAKATRIFLALSVAIGAGQAVVILAQAWLLASIITDAFLHGAGLGDLGSRLTLLAVTLIARAGLAWVAEVVAHHSSAAVKSELRMRLLHQVVRLGPRWLTCERSGELTTLATRGIDALDDYFSRYLPQLVLVCFVPLVVAGQMFAADWLSATIVVVTLPLIPIFMILVGLTTKQLMARQWASLQLLAHHFLDVLAGLGTLKSFGRSRAQVATIDRLANKQRKATMASLRIAFLSSLVLELLATLSVALVAVSVGLRLVDGRLDLQTALLVLILAPEAYLPLRLLGAHYHASAEGLGAAEQVFTVLDREVPQTGHGSVDASRTIEVEKVVVAAADRDGPSLDGLSLTIPAGQVTAVVGPSGCGKSTLLAVLLGFAELEGGRVVVGGTDLATADLDVWRSQVAWLSQDPVLFAGTVFENIRLGRPYADEDAVRRAAGAARVDVPLEKVIGERGNGVSAGQRRRIALARALLLDAPLLLLDEPTEGVDPETEHDLLSTLPTAFAGRTVVLVTHRAGLLSLCDHVIDLAPAQVPV